ncbi:DUF6454 family protein [Dyadobacter sp. CY312]|nr:DUF6454 family protein [Dyadobacter sp. CY312]
MKLTASSEWTQTDTVSLRFDAHHTQGIVKIGAHFFMTSVEVSEWPKKYDTPRGNLDRDAGKGIGHVMKFDRKGNLLHDLVIGEGDVYHPGGIDFDGRYIWIPVTEYRPNSFSIIYRLDPQSMEVKEVLRYPESIGAIVHNTDNHTLVGANWGARKFYSWQVNTLGQITNGNETPVKLGVENPSFYVDFQDCKYLGNNLMLGSGLQSFKTETGTFKLGGLEILDLSDYRPRRQIPVKLWSATGASMLNNPCAIESTKEGIRAYFVPDDDDKAVLYVYDVVM